MVLNRAVLQGSIDCDPRVSLTQNGKAIVNFSLSMNPYGDFSSEVVEIWNSCLSQGRLVSSGLVPSGLAPGLVSVPLTDKRRQRIPALLPQYFESYLERWQRFCECVARSPFLMGQGARRWCIRLDWILRQENLLKVLEGNFDDPASLDQNTEKASENARKNEVNAVLASIKDSTWREWCSQLDFSPESREFVSLMELKSIANAKFLEVEDDRLVWVGSSDRQTLSRIEDLRFKLLSIIQRTFPHIRNLRTRLEETHPLHRLNEENPHALSTKAIQQKGENDAE